MHILDQNLKKIIKIPPCCGILFVCLRLILNVKYSRPWNTLFRDFGTINQVTVSLTSEFVHFKALNLIFCCFYRDNSYQLRQIYHWNKIGKNVSSEIYISYGAYSPIRDCNVSWYHSWTPSDSSQIDFYQKLSLLLKPWIEHFQFVNPSILSVSSIFYRTSQK